MKPDSHDSDIPKRPLPNLEREKVVSTALELLNETGFEGLTVRKLADRLGVKASALYWHFESKQDLIDQLAARILEEEFTSRHPKPSESATWREVLTVMGNSMRSTLMRYRDGALVLASADLSKSNALRDRGSMAQKLLDEGFPLELALWSMHAVGRFTLGCVFEQQSDPRSKKEVLANYGANIEHFFADYPDVVAAFKNIDVIKIINSDYQYEKGLHVILAGVEYELSHYKQNSAA